MKKYLIIEADSNDGDYVTEKSLITDEQIELIKPVVEAIKNFKPYQGDRKDWKHKHENNFPMRECYREDLGEKTTKELYGHLEGFELFEEMVPYVEYGIHTICSVDILVISEEINLM